jgi:kynurenine formamidase
VLLDYRSYAKANGINYDPYTSHAITYEDLTKCGKAQGIDIRPEAQGGDIKVGDILMVRSGFVESYYERPEAERTALALRGHAHDGDTDEQKYAGLAQEEAIVDWLHDCYFAAVAGDAPSFERWPTPRPYYLHEYILARWGMPLGEMWNLERLAAKCKEQNRWFFFMTSAPANVPSM